MNQEYNKAKKKEIIKKLILTEEDVLAKFERLVKLASNFFSIEENSGRVMLKEEIKFTYPEMIFLITLGKYFAFHYDLVEDYSISLSEISEELGGIQITSLSKPISEMIVRRLVNKPQKGSYKVNPYKIENYLKVIHRKYFPNENLEKIKELLK